MKLLGSAALNLYLFLSCMDPLLASNSTLLGFIRKPFR